MYFAFRRDYESRFLTRYTETRLSPVIILLTIAIHAVVEGLIMNVPVVLTFPRQKSLALSTVL